MRPNHTIIHYLDGRVLKGYTYNLNPDKYHFHLFPIGDPGAKGIEVWLRDLKAVFFTRDLDGNPAYQERKDAPETERPGYRKVRVTFADGEILFGYTTRYDSSANGFFFVPGDPQSNNLRVFAVFTGVRQVTYLGPADPDLPQASTEAPAPAPAVVATQGSPGVTVP